MRARRRRMPLPVGGGPTRAALPEPGSIGLVEAALDQPDKGGEGRFGIAPARF